MKNNFEPCLQIILSHEGGFVNHPQDPGGATNKGITKKTYENFLKREVSIEELKNISDEHINNIYYKRYWNPVKGNRLPLGLDLSMFDWAVNSGPRRASKELQKVLEVSADGIIGKQTLGKIKEHDVKFLIENLHVARETFYRNLSTFETFGKGWLRRNKETCETSLDMIEKITLN